MLFGAPIGLYFPGVHRGYLRNGLCRSELAESPALGEESVGL
jgi:hypothetical protein